LAKAAISETVPPEEHVLSEPPAVAAEKAAEHVRPEDLPLDSDDGDLDDTAKSDQVPIPPKVTNIGLQIFVTCRLCSQRPLHVQGAAGRLG
jgi:hypothetical protein